MRKACGWAAGVVSNPGTPVSGRRPRLRPCAPAPIPFRPSVFGGVESERGSGAGWFGLARIRVVRGGRVGLCILHCLAVRNGFGKRVSFCPRWFSGKYCVTLRILLGGLPYCAADFSVDFRRIWTRARVMGVGGVANDRAGRCRFGVSAWFLMVRLMILRCFSSAL